MFGYWLLRRFRGLDSGLRRNDMGSRLADDVRVLEVWIPAFAGMTWGADWQMTCGYWRSGFRPSPE